MTGLCPDSTDVKLKKYPPTGDLKTGAGHFKNSDGRNRGFQKLERVGDFQILSFLFSAR
jgi:hypothetical protein